MVFCRLSLRGGDAPAEWEITMVRTKLKFNWQSNFRKIPDSIQSKVRSLKGNDLSVACVKKISVGEIALGRFAHLGIGLDGDKIAFKERVLPDPRVGRYSSVNVRGLVVIRKDLPMTTKRFSVEAPNFGDWTNGSHEVEWDREVYQRDFIPPKELTIDIELLDQGAKNNQSVYAFKFRVNEVLNRKEKKFEDDLFYSLNLLQENVGAVDVFPTNATRDDFLKTVFVEWEILPPGHRDEVVNRILSGYRSPSPELRKKLAERYDQLNRLKPTAFINGTSGFSRYFGAQFSPNLVAFENIEYGNALYLMYEDWETLSKKSRIDLLSGNRDGFDRIVHTGGWEEKLKKLVEEKRR
jgi:hypothetical protein